jgi:hypothetical protein
VLNDITTAPAALDQLDTWGAGDEVLAAMSESDLASVADAMERTHLHPSMYAASGATDAVLGRDPGVDTSPGARPVRGVSTRRSSPRAERLARVRRLVASQRTFTARAGRRPTVAAPAAVHRDVSSQVETGESRRHNPLDPAGAAPSSPTEPGKDGRATDPGATDVPPVASPDAFRGRIEPSGSPATGTDHPGVTDQGMPAASDGETTRLRAGEALAPQRPTTVPVSSVPVHPTESTGFPTQLAGLFYLIGALRAIELPLASPWGHERWAMLAALVHGLIGDTPDPIWQFLRDRAALPDPMEPFPPPALEATAAAALDSINEAFDLDDGELAEIVATPGVVYATSTHIDVQIALGRISMTARMRGLDADPGWCPELGHVIRFHFEDL